MDACERTQGGKKHGFIIVDETRETKEKKVYTRTHAYYMRRYDGVSRFVIRVCNPNNIFSIGR